MNKKKFACLLKRFRRKYKFKNKIKRKKISEYKNEEIKSEDRLRIEE